MKSLLFVVFYGVLDSVAFAQNLDVIGKEKPLFFLERKPESAQESALLNLTLNINISFSTILTGR